MGLCFTGTEHRSINDWRHPHSSMRNGDASARLLAPHHRLKQSSDDGQNCASGTATDDLTHDGPEIEAAARRACNRRNEGLQNLTSADPADGAGEGVAEIAQIVVLQCAAPAARPPATPEMS
jgi:hypothetical protein